MEEGKSPGEGIEGPLSQRMINGDGIRSGHSKMTHVVLKTQMKKYRIQPSGHMAKETPLNVQTESSALKFNVFLGKNYRC